MKYQGNFLNNFSFDVVILYDNDILFNIILRKIIGWYYVQLRLNIVQQIVGIMSLID